MEIKFTVKIKDDKNPPIFDKKLGKGVLSTVVVDFKGATEEDLKSPSFMQQVNEFKENLMKDWVEVIPQIK